MAATQEPRFEGAEALGAYTIAIKPTLAKPAIDFGLQAENRARLCARIRADPSYTPGGVVLLQGGETDYRHETDHEKVFRQESFFAWAFGVKEPDCYGSIDVDSGLSTLYIPRLPDSYAVVMGPILPASAWKESYGVSACRYVDELVASVSGPEEAVGRAAKPSAVLVLSGFNTDGKRHARPASYPGMEAALSAAGVALDMARLWPAITECRVFKTAREIELLRFSAGITSEAHIAVMQHTTALTKKAEAAVAAAAAAAGAGGAGAGASAASAPALYEFQMESLFHHWTYYNGGCRHLSYTCICASGANGAVLHYGHAGQPNSKAIRAGDMCLFDMGSEYNYYGSDITTSFPANGVFTADQRMVYDGVWEAVKAVESAMRPGVVWTDMQTLSYRCVLTQLKRGGVLVGDVDEMMAVNLGATFMPHGLGHFLGLDTHDVGGYNGPDMHRPTLPGFASLRTVRALQAGMYITVEPGCYFNDSLLDSALADPARARFIDAAVLQRFRGFGGVRIEDDVLVTETGCENFTLAPRIPEEVEAACAGRITSVAQVTKFC